MQSIPDAHCSLLHVGVGVGKKRVPFYTFRLTGQQLEAQTGVISYINGNLRYLPQSYPPKK